MTNPSRQKADSSGKATSRTPKIVSIDAGGHREKVVAKRNALVEKNLHLVPPIALDILQNMPPSFELDDLIQTGRIGLMAAASRYRPKANNGTPFSAYARKVIKGTIQMSTRRRNYAEATHISLDAAMSFDERLQGSRAVRERDKKRTGRDLPIQINIEPRVESDVEISIDRKRLVKRISIEREKLTDLQAAVFTAYHSVSMPSLATVAAQLGIHEWKVKRAHTEALVILRKILNAA